MPAKPQPKRPNRRAPRPKQPPRTEDVVLHGFTHGGEAVGRLADGKAVFVPFAIPGERVRISVTDERSRWARGSVLELLDASPNRIEPGCPLFGTCGGCALQHIEPDTRRALLRQVIVDQLERIGGFTAPPVAETRAAGDWAYRNSARFAVDAQGRLGFRAARSHTIVPIDVCPLLHPTVQATRSEAGDVWQTEDIEEVVVRAASQGEGATLITLPGAAGGTIHEVVGGFTFRVSPDSFFQQNTAGAEIALALVREAAAAQADEQALDLFAGVGLFARGLAEDGANVIAVETSEAAVADARENLAGFPAEIWHGSAAEALDELDDPVDIIVLDPPRTGAGIELMQRLAGLGARVIVYVACDPAALARDARGLVDAGYTLQQVTPIDQFAQTAHIEAVAVFSPAG